MKLYGSLTNRIEENHQIVDEITVGTGVTKFYWSDREAYEVIEVKDQKHIKVREYDHKPNGGHYSNDWLLVSNESNNCYDLVKRGKYWYEGHEFNFKDYEEIYAKKIRTEKLNEDEFNKLFYLNSHGISIEELKNKKKISRYNKWDILIGKAVYYYDYEF